MHTFKDSEQALQCLRQQGNYRDVRRPGLVVMDLMLDVAGKHGFEIIAEMKDDPELRSIPIVVLTEGQQEADILEAYSGGAYSFISRPLDFDRLQETATIFSQYWALVTRLPDLADTDDSPLISTELSTDVIQALSPDTVTPLEILVVDDSESDALLVQITFEQSNLVNVVHVVEDGEEAMAYLHREGKYQDAARPGLVLLDINMPRKNGFEVLAEMKQDPDLRTIPVVMLTMSQQDADVRRAFSDGACSFIPKPVNFEDMTVIAQQFALYWSLVAEVPHPHTDS